MKVLALITLSLIAGSLAIELTGTIRDFTSSHPDFEPTNKGDDRGIAATSLDIDGKPVLDGTHSTVNSATSFAQWFRDADGINVPIAFTVNALANGQMYEFNAPYFFPIEGKGYGNGAQQHNFYFTTEVKSTFVHQAGTSFTFCGNDDVFLFVNGVRVLDLGGIHDEECATVDFDTLSLTVGKTYNFNFFHANRHSTISVFKITTNIQLGTSTTDAPTNPGRPAYICEVFVPDFCPGTPIPTPTPEPEEPVYRRATCPEDPQVTLNPNDPAYLMSGFNLISFGGFSANSGDVEGRALIRNNLNLPKGGYSFGDKLRTKGSSAVDDRYPYSLVVGGDINFASGGVYPRGDDIPFPAFQEDIFGGGAFLGAPDLAARKTGSCATPGCLEEDLNNALEYYTQLQTVFDQVSDNAVASVLFQTLTITCNSKTETSVSLHIDGTVFSGITAYSLVGCSETAQIVININGNGDVTFAGMHLEHRAEKVLYNILGEGRNINIQTEVRGSILAPKNKYVQTGGVVVGLVIVGDVISALQINRLVCEQPAPPPHPPPSEHSCPDYEAKCEGLDFPLGDGIYSFRDFNVISFMDFIGDTGDIEGRLAAKRDVKLGNGYSIGYELKTANSQPDNSLPYSLIVGRDLTWGSGSLHPDGTFGYPGNREDMFVGGNFQTAADYLTTRRTGGPCAYSGCLDGYFNAAKQCYNTFQNNLAAVPDNVAKKIEWSALIITCADNTASRYTVSLLPSEMSQFTYVMLDNCNFQAEWAINIRGTDNVDFRGDTFPAPAGGVVYNVIGSGRTITVTDTALGGHLLAPGNTLDQTGGVVIGKVVAGNVKFSLQINKPNCPEPGNVPVPTVVVEPPSLSAPNSLYIGINSPNFIEGSSVRISGLDYEVQAVVNEVHADGSIAATRLDLDRAIVAYPPAGAQVVGQVDGTKSTPPATAEQSGAASLTVAFTFVFALVALLF